MGTGSTVGAKSFGKRFVVAVVAGVAAAIIKGSATIRNGRIIHQVILSGKKRNRKEQEDR